MRCSHSADYSSRLRSDSATTRKAKNSDYYLNDLECPIIVWMQWYMFVTESYGLGIVTMSWQILLYTIKIVTMCCVEPQSHIQEFYWHPFPIKKNQKSDQDHKKRFSNRCLPSASVKCLVTVWLHSGESGCCWDRFGHYFTIRSIQIGSVWLYCSSSMTTTYLGILSIYLWWFNVNKWPHMFLIMSFYPFIYMYLNLFYVIALNVNQTYHNTKALHLI